MFKRTCAPDGLPEIDIQHVLQVVAFFRLRLWRFGASAEELRKDSRKPPDSASRAGPLRPPPRSWRRRIDRRNQIR